MVYMRECVRCGVIFRTLARRSDKCLNCHSPNSRLGFKSKLDDFKLNPHIKFNDDIIEKYRGRI